MMTIFACCFFINNVLNSIKIAYNKSFVYSRMSKCQGLFFFNSFSKAAKADFKLGCFKMLYGSFYALI